MNIERLYIRKFEDVVRKEPMEMYDLLAQLEELGFSCSIPKIKNYYINVYDAGIKYRIYGTSVDFELEVVPDNGEREQDPSKVVSIYRGATDAARLIAQVIKINRDVHSLDKALDIAQERDPETEEF